MNNNTAEQNDRSIKEVSSGRSGRSGEREIELQNQLLDLQENYTALSQRHAKLISDMTRARDNEEPSGPTSEYTDTAIERLNRSNSFAEAVEQVVLEYEKTIQSLETSLTSTRGSLSGTESSLLEKESKLAYIETVNHQLQSRLQKMMDRESSTETYLQDLENKLHGHNTGEEKNTTIITELKKEIARVRENEAGCEDYISTLEERLAEGEQDMELMQREIDRLEHVVERQRSLGKLDNLLLELDSTKSQENRPNGKEDGEDVERPTSKAESHKSAEGPPDHAPLFRKRAPTPIDSSSTPPIQESAAEEDYIPEQYARIPENGTYDYAPPSPAQSQFVEDKLESVQQELIDLRVEHESTIHEFDQMSTNYESVLRNLAILQDQLDEARHSKKMGLMAETASRGTSPPESPFQRPASFLADARVSELKDTEEQPSSSRSLSSELSLLGESATSTDLTETYGQATSNQDEMEAQRLAAQDKEEALQRELEKLRKEKARIQRIHEEEHEELHLQLRISMDQLSELRSRDRSGNSTSPSQLLRRKSSQSLAVLDRAQRAFNNLRRIAGEHFPDDPEILDNFELNLESAMRELQNRSDRIQDLEHEVHSIRREMDSKAAMIAGLTRERTSIQSSPMDISVVAIMERRIEDSETELHRTRSRLALREEELNSAKNALTAASGESQSDAVQLLEELTKERQLNAEQASKIAELQNEVRDAKEAQDQLLGTLQNSKDTLDKTIQDLQGQLAREKAEALKQEQTVRETAQKEIGSYQERIEALQTTIAENKETISAQLNRVAGLEKSHSQINAHIEDRSADTSDEDLQSHRDAAGQLEKTIAQNKEVIEAQQQRLTTLEQSYEEAVAELETLRTKEAAAAAALAEAETRAAQQAAAAEVAQETLAKVQSELSENQSNLAEQIAYVAKLQSSHDESQALLKELETSTSATDEDKTRHSEAHAELEAEIMERNATIAEHVATISALEAQHTSTQLELQKTIAKEQGHSKLLEELEQQLTYTFDESQETANRLKELTSEHESLRTTSDASAQTIATLESEIAALKTRVTELELELSTVGARAQSRSNSTSSTNAALRKSSSSVSLPSPPPAIPLPPLPGALPATPAATSPSIARRPSKDYVATHIEDQEARIKTLEKQLQAEKALTATLEEALTDCEKTMKRLTTDRDSFQARASQVQQELERTKNESQSSRYSMQAVEEERLARQKAEAAREQLEMRMQALSKKKQRSFACF